MTKPLPEFNIRPTVITMANRVRIGATSPSSSQLRQRFMPVKLIVSLSTASIYDFEEGEAEILLGQ